jgi:CheY-like chemotaxis protein
MSSSHRGILLVEDDEHDVFFMQRAMAKAGMEPPIHIAYNGQEAVDYLSGSGKYGDRSIFPLPVCMFLDLKLPFIHGFQVLEWLQQQPMRSEISVVILTSSPEERDRQRAKELGAKSYIVKPPSAKLLEDLSMILPACFPKREPNGVAAD